MQRSQNEAPQTAQVFAAGTSSWLRQRVGSRGRTCGRGAQRGRLGLAVGRLGVGGSFGSAGAAAVLSQGTRLPWPHSQKRRLPAISSGRPWRLPHCLQVNQIIENSGSHALRGNEERRGATAYLFGSFGAEAVCRPG